MTTEPRQEAQQIAKRIMVAATDAGSAETLKQITPFPQMKEDWQPSVDAKHAESGRQMKRLVDALAAAIEARDAIKWDYSFLHGRHGASLLIGHEEACEFNRALSALREDET